MIIKINKNAIPPRNPNSKISLISPLMGSIDGFKSTIVIIQMQRSSNIVPRISALDFRITPKLGFISRGLEAWLSGILAKYSFNFYLSFAEGLDKTFFQKLYKCSTERKHHGC
jgi:hypothetical protein